MKYLLAGLLLTSLLSGCADEKEIIREYYSDNTPDVQEIVDQENIHREFNGQTPLTTGLVCKLYSIAGGSTILSGSSSLLNKTLQATYIYKGSFNQVNSSISQGLNVLPESLRSTYKNLYYLTCSGYIVVVQSNYYSFSLESDDGSLLYLDGSLLINNDDNHGSTTKSNSKYLKRGIHSFKLDYAQTGGGNQSLILKSGGELVDPLYFYH